MTQFALVQQLAPDVARRQAVAEQVRACSRCPLSSAPGVHPVPWTIVPGSPLLALAEAPGSRENAHGAPLIGPAGKHLDRVLAEAGLDPASFSRGNVANCYPALEGHSSAPTAGEVEACRPNFLAQLELIKPRFILVLGNVALNALYSGLSISAAHGLWWHEAALPGKPWCLATYHPSALLRSGSRKTTPEDLAIFRQGIEQGELLEGRATCAMCRQPACPRPPKSLPFCDHHLSITDLLAHYFPGAVCE